MQRRLKKILKILKNINLIGNLLLKYLGIFAIIFFIIFANMHWKNRDKNHPPADWEPTVNWQASTTPAVAINTTQAAASEIDQASKPSIMNHLKLKFDKKIKF